MAARTHASRRGVPLIFRTRHDAFLVVATGRTPPGYNDHWPGGGTGSSPASAMVAPRSVAPGYPMMNSILEKQ